jgi:hypothetical protein
VKKKISSLWWGVMLMHITFHGVAPTVMVEERLSLNFSIPLIWRTSIGAANPPSALVLGER